MNHVAVRPWGVDRLDDLVSLARVALPDEELARDDLEWACFDDPPRDAAGDRVGPTRTVGVDGAAGPVGAAAVALRHLHDRTVSHLQLLVVAPGARRRGVARALLAHLAATAAVAGAEELQLGGAAPFYLFSGVDSRWTAALCLAEDLGFHRVGVELDLVATAVPRTPDTDPTARAVAGAVIEWVPDGGGEVLADTEAFLSEHYPHWTDELRRGARRGRVVVARDRDGVIGVAAHSVNRAGVVGPVAVHPDRRGGGVGTVLMDEVLADLHSRGLDRAEIAWTSTVRFYALACDARVLRTSTVWTKQLARGR